jgi:hypothetical protein
MMVLSPGNDFCVSEFCSVSRFLIKNQTFRAHVHTGTGTHTNFYSMGSAGYFPQS